MINVGPRKEQALDLEFRVKNLQYYNSVSNPGDVVQNKLGPEYLSDVSIERLKNDVLMQHPHLLQVDAFHVLEEGLLRDIEYGLDKVVVAITYNFAMNTPLIEVPGRFVSINPERRTVDVQLLGDGEQIRLSERILKKSHMLDRQNAYTGAYNIWPRDAPTKFGLEIKTPI